MLSLDWTADQTQAQLAGIQEAKERLPLIQTSQVLADSLKPAKQPRK